MTNRPPTTVLPNARSLPRLAWTTLFATILIFCFIPMGCAATDEVIEAPPQPAEPLERSLPSSTIAALRACANDGVARLSRHSYDISFQVRVTSTGVVRDVEPKGKRLDDPAIEACLIRALGDMSVVDLLPVDEPLPETSQSILPPGRSLLGTTTLLPQVIRLAPIVLTGSGVTIVVGVAIVVLTAAVVVKMSKECKKQWDRGREKCDELLSSGNPPRGLTGGYKNPQECAAGFVDERCGGNRLDWGDRGARPGRRT